MHTWYDARCWFYMWFILFLFIHHMLFPGQFLFSFSSSGATRTPKRTKYRRSNNRQDDQHTCQCSFVRPTSPPSADTGTTLP